MKHLTALITIAAVCLAFVIATPAAVAAGLDDKHAAMAEKTIAKATEFLRKTQNADGSWSPEVGPAITALCLTALLDQPGIGPNDPTCKKAIDYLLSRQKDDGGIYDTILTNYNTSIAISALARARGDERVEKALEKAEKFIRGLQFGVGREGEFAAVHHGGVNYGKHGRPDLSNLQVFAQALHDLGCKKDDPAMVAAANFAARLQGSDANDGPLADKIVKDGGAIYAPSIDKDHVGVPESKASQDMIDEGKAGRPVSGLRTYGSMTYAMFKTYVYAQLPRDDKRVVDAVGWIRRNYTVDRNPGMPEAQQYQGHYYYLVTMTRALRAWNEPITDLNNEPIHWQNDVVAKLTEMQKENGSYINEADRWMEGDPSMVTAFALIALNESTK